MNNAPRPLFRHSVEFQAEECARACEHCATLCELTLHADPGYLNSIEPFSEIQLTLISFSSVCKLTATALRESRPDVPAMCSWCWQVCHDFSETARQDAVTWRRFGSAVLNCSSLCAKVAAGVADHSGHPHTRTRPPRSIGRRL
jgi:hypothetical protein